MIMTIGLIRASRTGKFRYRTAHPKSLFNGERSLLGLARAMVDVQAAIYSPGGGFWLPILQYDPQKAPAHARMRLSKMHLSCPYSKIRIHISQGLCPLAGTVIAKH